MKEKVLITGARGSVAKNLSAILLEDGYETCYLTTQKNPTEINHFNWDYTTSYIDTNALHNVSHIIHLSGLNIAKPWTKKNKKIMYESRIYTSQLLFNTCKKLNIQPKTFISASAMGVYKSSIKQREEFDNPGNDWMSKLCVDWEKSADNFKSLGSRVVKLRFSLILDKKSGILKNILMGFKFYIGVIFGNGTEPFPWIHINDVTRFIKYSITNDSINEAYNLVTNNDTNYSFISNIKKTLSKYSVLIYVPKPLVKLIFGEQSKIILNEISLSCKRMHETGFKCQINTIEKALKQR